MKTTTLTNGIFTMKSFQYFTKDSWEMWEEQIQKIFIHPIKAPKEQGIK